MMGRFILLGALAAALAFAASPAAAAPPASFGEPGEGAGQMNRPRGIAVEQSSGDVYINDAFNSRADKFGPEGEFLLSFGWGVRDGAAELQSCGPEASPPTTTCLKGILAISEAGPGQFGIEPSGIAVDDSGVLGQQGDVYVQDAPNRVEKFSPSGQFIFALGGEVNKTIHANLCTAASGNTCGSASHVGPGPGEFERLGRGTLAVGPDGTLYVGDKERIQKFSPAGAFEGQIAFPGIVAEQIAVDSESDIYVGSNSFNGVHKYDPTGTELGEPRDPSLHGPNLAIGPADELFVLGSGPFRSLDHVDLFDSSGKQLSAFPSPEISLTGGIAYGNAIERLYLVDRFQAKVDLLAAPPPGPLLRPASAEATEVKKTSASLCAAVNPEGAPTTVHFQYITAAEFKADGETFGAGTEVTAESAPLGSDFEYHPACQEAGGLAPDTAYRFRVLATSSEGGASGETASFTTQPPFLIDAAFATEVSATSATLGTEINPLGEAVTYHFEYDTLPYTEGEAPHGTVLPIPDASAGSGLADVTRTAPLQGLIPLTTYHYRVSAQSPLATIQSPDRSFTTQGAFASLLPDGRGFELVSPVDKRGVPLEGISEEGAVIQAAADGSGIAYAAFGSIGAGAAGNRSAVKSQLLSTRTAAGWSTRDLTTPHREPAGVTPGTQTEYRLFSTDLSLGALQPEGATPLSPQTTEKTPYLLGSDGSYLPLVTAANVPEGTHFGGDEGGPEHFGGTVDFVTANPDLSHVLLASPTALTADFDPAFKSGPYNTYEWSAGALRLVSQIPTGPATTCGPTGPACIPASEAGQVSKVGNSDHQVRNAISTDGSRVVFSTTIGENRLYLRDLARGETVQLDAAQGGSGKSGGGLFQIASADGSRVFFTDDSRLTPGSTAKTNEPDLYMCQVEVKEEHLACALSDLTVNTINATEPATVRGTVIGAAADGSSLYFVANGILTEDEGAVAGNCAAEVGLLPTQTCNLYRYDVEAQTTRLVAVLSGADFHDWQPLSGDDLGALTARVSPNGRYLAFMSGRPLSGYDNRDAKSGQPDQEVFLYDSQAAPGEALACASCDPTGARPRGVEGIKFPGLLVDRPELWAHRWLAANIPGWTRWHGGSALYQSRYLSNSGRLFFNAADSLVPQDTNGTFDVYQFEFPQGPGQPASNTCATSSTTYSPQSGGCASLITSGTSPEESAFLDASESGDDVFFLTASKLAPTDEDAALDVYDARSGGSSTAPVKPVECAGDGCQQPALPPNDPTPGSLTFQGAGNVVECPKGKVKKSGKCVAKKPKKAKHNEKQGKKSRRSAEHGRAK